MKSRHSGLFITFEGTEGAGKSTLIREIAQQLEAAGIPRTRMTLTREPGGSWVAERIRALILEEPVDGKMDSWTELFLYEAARAEHLARTVMPALDSGHVVLCDRYADSSLAYQGNARGLAWKQVKGLNQIATRGLKPKLTVLLDVDPAVGLKRASNPNRFEREGLEFQKKVRAGYLKAVREEPGRWLVVKPAERSPSELAAAILQHLRKKKWLKLR